MYEAFPWIQQLIDAVPEGYKPDLSPSRPGDEVLGPLPEELARCVKAALFAADTVEKLAAIDESDEKKIQALAEDADLMGALVNHSLARLFPEKSEVSDRIIDISPEGVVLRAKDPLAALVHNLRSQGISVRTIRI